MRDCDVSGVEDLNRNAAVPRMKSRMVVLHDYHTCGTSYRIGSASDPGRDIMILISKFWFNRRRLTVKLSENY